MKFSDKRYLARTRYINIELTEYNCIAAYCYTLSILPNTMDSRADMYKILDKPAIKNRIFVTYPPISMDKKSTDIYQQISSTDKLVKFNRLSVDISVDNDNQLIQFHQTLIFISSD